jgi:hypothetical protein
MSAINRRGLRVWPSPGAVVRLTGHFSRCTGQQASSEGRKRWRVVQDCGIPGCTCHAERPGDLTASFTLVPVDEPLPREGFEDVQSTRPDGRLMRHISAANLEVVGAPPRAADQADECPPVKQY